jgi:hypothetical protein
MSLLGISFFYFSFCFILASLLYCFLFIVCRLRLCLLRVRISQEVFDHQERGLGEAYGGTRHFEFLQQSGVEGGLAWMPYSIVQHGPVR